MLTVYYMGMGFAAIAAVLFWLWENERKDELERYGKEPIPLAVLCINVVAWPVTLIVAAGLFALETICEVWDRAVKG